MKMRDYLPILSKVGARLALPSRDNNNPYDSLNRPAIGGEKCQASRHARGYMYPGAEVRLYRYGAVLAEELNFTCATVPSARVRFLLCFRNPLEQTSQHCCLPRYAPTCRCGTGHRRDGISGKQCEKTYEYLKERCMTGAPFHSL